jgi:ribosomal protein L16 Arg81 hydroxylase
MPDFGLEELLRPVGARAFALEHFEKKPLFLQRSSASYHASLFRLEDMDRLHLLSRPQYTQVFAIDSRRKIATDEYADARGEVDAVRLFELFEEGATIVHRNVDAYCVSVATLCRSMEKYFNSPFSANAYWAPAGGRAFPVHYDANNVFALQISGSKQWRVYPSQTLPLRDEHCYDALADENPLAQYTLNAGDMLYVPRGFPHLVCAADQPSLHISLYSFPYTWVDVLQRSVADALRKDAAFRASLPMGFLGDDRADLEEAFSRLINRLAESARLELGLRSIWNELLSSRSPWIENPRESVGQAHALSQNSWIEVRKDLLYSIETGPDAIRLMGQGVAVSFDPSVLSGLIFALQTARFQIQELPGPPEAAGKLDLVRTLVLNGFCAVSRQDGGPA